MSINVGEYGQALNVFVAYDMSFATSLLIEISRPDESMITGQAVLGTTPLVTDGGTFAANQYCTYKVKDGDLSLPGDHTVRLTYTDASKRLISDPTSFSVSP
jgi:hypothetical protein